MVAAQISTIKLPNLFKRESNHVMINVNLQYVMFIIIMKKNVYRTIQLIEKNKETSLLSNVMDTRQRVEQLSSSLLSIDQVLKTPSVDKQQFGGLFDQNNNDYRVLIKQVSQQLENQYTTQHNELKRQEFHLTRQATRTKLIETIIVKKQQEIRKKQAEREQSTLSDLLSISRKKSIFN